MTNCTPGDEDDGCIDHGGDKECDDDELAVVDVVVVVGPAEEGDADVEDGEGDEDVEGEEWEQEGVEEGEGAAVELAVGAADLGEGDETADGGADGGGERDAAARIMRRESQIGGPL